MELGPEDVSLLERYLISDRLLAHRQLLEEDTS